MPNPNAVAVFCGSSPGNEPAFTHAALSLGSAVGRSGKAFVYGGGEKGIMGTVSKAALEAGGKVTGVLPYAMAKDAKEIGQTSQVSKNKVETIVVGSMHERKVEMAKRVGGFVGLPGGYGTFEELLEVITWSQLEIHNKPVILVNVLGFYNPLRDLIRSGIRSGFIQPQNEDLVIFIDGPSDMSAHESYNWGQDVLNALDAWKRPEWEGYGYKWTKNLDGQNGSPLEAS